MDDMAALGEWFLTFSFWGGDVGGVDPISSLRPGVDTSLKKKKQPNK